MAYMNQEIKKTLAPAIKAVLKKFDVKGTIAVRNHSTLVINLKEGAIDFVNAVNTRENHLGQVGEFHYQVNPYYIGEHWEGVAADFLSELKDAMMTGNHDRSDLMTDYHDVGWYVDINIGHWNKEFVFTGELEQIAEDLNATQDDEFFGEGLVL